MCGRFALIASAPRLARLLGLVQAPELAPRYNIAPSQPVAAVRAAADGARRMDMLRWGLIPAWAKQPKPDFRMINAKAETLSERPAYRAPFRRRRCLIPADGFYEWQRLEDRKQPFYISRRDGNPLAFAGLWEQWSRDGDTVVESCTIVTTAANETVAPVHDRMPVVLEAGDFELWLDPSVVDVTLLQPLLRPYGSEELQALPVSNFVNSPRNEGPRCIQPATES
jgi:putative SOS response-associated peptidase YedK